MGAKPVEVEMPGLTHDLNKMRQAVNERTKLIFLPSPNNPTGTANTEEEIHTFVRSLPQHVIFCFDEAYAEYLDSPLIFDP
jgi:histidinol-phosphate aminotransferase